MSKRLLGAAVFVAFGAADLAAAPTENAEAGEVCWQGLYSCGHMTGEDIWAVCEMQCNGAWTYAVCNGGAQIVCVNSDM
jgi:hypothetical protein